MKQYRTERIRHKGKPVPLMTVSGVFKSLRHLKQSSTKGTDLIDGKVLRLSAPFITDTITYIYNLIIEKNKFPKVSQLVSWCFEPSQPQRITSGLKTNLGLSPSYS